MAPQPGIFALGTRYHHHLELDLVDSDASLSDLMSCVTHLQDEFGTVGGLNIVVGFSAETWEAVSDSPAPRDLGSFEAITGPDGFTMPASQHDLWVWVHGGGRDEVFSAARLVVAAFKGVATLKAEQTSFVFGDSQDLTGFEDGTANPPVLEATSLASVPPGEPGAGGSVTLLQRWVHDLDSFEALEVADQEQVFGRTRHDSIEIPDDERAEDAHVSRVEIEDDDGEELKVFRRSTPFGDVGEHGLVFVAFSADRHRLQQMLENMAGVTGVRDRLTHFSTPVSGAWYFAPSAEDLLA